MKLKKLEIRERGLKFDNSINISINIEEKHLFYSDKNSKGKTSLIRFLIHSLGFKIPSTKKVDMKKYKTILLLERDDKNLISLEREDNNFSISFRDGTNFIFNLEEKLDQFKALSIVFQCNKSNLLENILPVFYIDQDKGWRLVNRGKVLGDNSFNIEDFILSLNDKIEEDIASDIKALKEEIKRYEAIQCLMAYEIDVNESKDIFKQSDIVDQLLIQQGIKKFEIKEKEDEISNLKIISNDNSSLLDFIEKYNLTIKYQNDEFVLERKHIKDFIINQNILQARINSLEIEKKAKLEELAKLNRKIDEANVLIKPEKIEDIIAHEVHNLPITGGKLDDFINQKKKQLGELKALRKNIVKDSNSGIADNLANDVLLIADKMDVLDIVTMEKDFIFTRNIKALSGAILHKVSLAYKISYIKAIDKYIGIKLPIIIDSPCSGEVTPDNARVMIKTVMKELPDHQVIVASIHQFEEQNFKRMKLVNGVFGKYEIE